ncbi:hypothetical protein QBC33DRAFT_515932 [Phialemonium atrogriseum]|uniref:Uncharacterized protein n=1 Tax=Phialemonium atrogriseum TaxID=1093897 RepID=A0AAJ0C2V9_9PEZI|nr:uncharacterized protein QBC33DRAFT_515932 [Phialemonium atrogriseum]KAK1766611.1 hypothetical protein QBC33DRAFT_515932 [Phialemonium atrogriseum]
MTMKLLSLSTLLLFTGLAAAGEAQPACPTITSHALCPTCPVNACLKLDTVTIPCGCPTASVPTATITHTCPSNPDETCFAPPCASTSYATVTESCNGGGGCPTVTSTVRAPDCTPPPPAGGSVCVELACLEVVPMTWPCSCVGSGPVPTATVTGPYAFLKLDIIL